MNVLHQRMLLDASIEKVWSFFVNPHNLKIITPPTLGFEILGNPPTYIFNGQHIYYRVKPMFGIPMTWVSRIADVIDKKQFVDIQILGPYRYWHHLHQFTETKDGVIVEDIVHYLIPFQPFSNVILKTIVQHKLKNIFLFREQVIGQMFPILETELRLEIKG